jgi:hypothetical protein
MTDRNANDRYLDSADDAARQDEMDRDPDILPDQDLDQAAGGLYSFKTRDAGSASDWQGKNDKPESDAHAR